MNLAAGFYGVGAYTAAILAVNYHVPFLYVLPLAMLISGLLVLIVSAIAIRTVDDYFIICTLGIQVVVFSLMNNWMALTRGPLGIPGIWGSVFAAAFLVFLPEMLRFVGLPNSIAANLRQIIYGTILIFTMFRYSQGFHAGIFLNCSEGNRNTVP
ncbi:hypothetical protein FACS189454_00210 [Planctomycetales bacterium]|nr:hypothetical protein FACS189454_00210 [Planctomycetales bacterium]